ncbi:MAG TPA: hypothetical protein VN625_05630, partial [Desulfuromonadaceae bacterium]|nr:hypothetical protein [Desulfuromonadaceae bacterium]
ATSKMRGPDFRASFEVPVFGVPGGADTASDDVDPTRAFQAPIEEIRREENSRIQISDGPAGKEFYFPAARNVGTMLVTTAAMFVFDGVTVALFRFHAPILFPIIFGLVSILLTWGVFNGWLRSTRVIIGSAAVRITNEWLMLSSSRQFSPADVARFATRAGMQSGSHTFSDIRLIGRGADEKFAAEKERLQGSQDVNQLMIKQFRSAAGPSGVTAASNIGSAVEAEWLVGEMNKALQLAQQGGYAPGEVGGGPMSDTRPLKMGITILTIIALAGGAGYWYWRQPKPVPVTPPVESSKSPGTTNSVAPKPIRPQPAVLAVAFSSFGSGGEYAADGLTIKAGDGHGEWFVSEGSGRVYAIELKIDPVSEPTRRLTVAIMEDDNGMPGRPLETWAAPGLIRTNTLGWLDLNSRQRPTLKAGTKYWIHARSPGAWYWHFNNQNIVQDSLRLLPRQKWVAAGTSNVCAFSVLIETNQPSSR